MTKCVSRASLLKLHCGAHRGKLAHRSNICPCCALIYVHYSRTSGLENRINSVNGILHSLFGGVYCRRWSVRSSIAGWSVWWCLYCRRYSAHRSEVLLLRNGYLNCTCFPVYPMGKKMIYKPENWLWSCRLCTCRLCTCLDIVEHFVEVDI